MLVLGRSVLSETPITTIVGKDVKFECKLPTSNPPRIQWTDYVFNSGRNPILIFNSSNSGINEAHPQKDKFEMDGFNLTVKSVKLDFAGEYFCESRVNDTTTLKQTFDLTIGGEQVLFLFCVHLPYWITIHTKGHGLDRGGLVFEKLYTLN